MSKETIYCLGWEINTSEQSSFKDFVKTHRIDKKHFEKLTEADYSCLKIEVLNGVVHRVEDCSEYNFKEVILQRELSSNEVNRMPSNPITYLISTKTETETYLGGESIDDFEMPNFEVLNAPFQYIGRLNSKELGLDWMPFENLNLCYPLYTGIGEVLFFDYTNSLQPKLLNCNVYVDHVYGHFSSTMKHVFDKYHLESISILDLNGDQDLSFDFWHEAITGNPFWIQAPSTPRCPKTGRLMRVVAQITTCDRVKVKESNMVSEMSCFEDDASSMHFWGGGSMYVFIEPNSKIVGILIQST